jgi:hypothetical protein
MVVHLKFPTAAAGSLAAGLACAAIIVHAGSATAGVEPGLYVGTQPLRGAVVATSAPVDLLGSGAASVSWVVDGVYVGRDAAAPFRLELRTSPGPHKLKARSETAAGVETTYEVQFSSTAGSTPTPTDTSTPTTTSTSSPTTTSSPTSPTGQRVRTVRTSSELTSALSTARPNDVIDLADGTYSGRFVAATPGTAAAPITLRGTRRAVLNGGTTSSGYTLHLNGAHHWRLTGFTVRGGQKGVVLDRSSFGILSGLDVGSVGMEAVHLRTASSDNRVENSLVHHTGLYEPGYGEGVYIGSATSNWSKYGSNGGPDRSDRNVISGNHIYATTAESVDVKEGTTGGRLVGNRFDGVGMTGVHFADSWIDLKGNAYRVTGNTGVSAPLDGIQTHVQLDGWGRDNVLSANVLTVGASGYGINVYRADTSTGNVVRCDNVVVGAASGASNVRCTP